jgi:hypothetical protein
LRLAARNAPKCSWLAAASIPHSPSPLILKSPKKRGIRLRVLIHHLYPTWCFERSAKLLRATLIYSIGNAPTPLANSVLL